MGAIVMQQKNVGVHARLRAFIAFSSIACGRVLDIEQGLSHSLSSLQRALWEGMLSCNTIADRRG